MPFDGVGFVTHESLGKLDAVVELIGTPDRWCKGALRSHDGRYCIRGAVRAVDGAELLEPAILQAVVEVAGRRFRRIEGAPMRLPDANAHGVLDIVPPGMRRPWYRVMDGTLNPGFPA